MHKNVHFDPKIVQKGDNDVPQNSQIEPFLDVTVSQILNSIAKMSLSGTVSSGTFVP